MGFRSHDGVTRVLLNLIQNANGLRVAVVEVFAAMAAAAVVFVGGSLALESRRYPNSESVHDGDFNCVNESQAMSS